MSSRYNHKIAEKKWQKKWIDQKIFESKKDTLNTLSEIKAKSTKSIFYSSDEMLVFATNFILESENLNRAILFSVIFKDGLAIKMISANGEGR